MYHFVKFNKTWYLKPETLQDVIDHFIKICGREFKQGFDDFKDNVGKYVRAHHVQTDEHWTKHWENNDIIK